MDKERPENLAMVDGMKRKTPYELLEEMAINVNPEVDSCILMNYLINYDTSYVGFLEKFGWKNIKVLTSYDTNVPAEIKKQLKENLKTVDVGFFGGILHGKCCLFTVGGEKLVCIIGSFNLTNDGLNSNIESFCVLEGRYKGKKKIIDYLKDDVSNREIDEVLGCIVEGPNSYVIEPLITFLMKLWSGDFESKEFVSDVLLTEMQRYDRFFVHTLGKNSIKKSIQLIIQRLSKIKSENPILIRIISPYHSKQSFYGLVNLIEESIQQFLHEGLSFKIELLTNLGFKSKYDRSIFTDPDFLLQLYKNEIQFPGKLGKDQIKFEFRFWDQSKRLNTDLFLEKRFLHLKMFIISRDMDSRVLLTSSNFTSGGLGLEGSIRKNIEIGMWEQDLEKVMGITEEIETIWENECEPFDSVGDEVSNFYNNLPLGGKFYSLDNYISLKRNGFSGTSIPLSKVPKSEILLVPKNICPKFSKLSTDILMILDDRILGKKENYPLIKEGNTFKLSLNKTLSDPLVKKEEKWEKITLQFIFKMKTKWRYDESITSLDQLTYYYKDKNTILVDGKSGDEKPLSSRLIGKMREKELDGKILRHYAKDSNLLRCKMFRVSMEKEIPDFEISLPKLGCVLTESSIIIPLYIKAKRGKNLVKLNAEDFEFFISNKTRKRLHKILSERVVVRKGSSSFPFVVELDPKKHGLSLGNVLKILIYVKENQRWSFELPIIAQTMVKSANIMELMFDKGFLTNKKIDENTKVFMEIDRERLELENVKPYLWKISLRDYPQEIVKLFIQGFEESPLYFAKGSITDEISAKIKCFSLCETFYKLSLIVDSGRMNYLEKNCSNFESWQCRSPEDLHRLIECPFISSNCGVVTKDNELNVFLSFHDPKFFNKMVLEWVSDIYRGQTNIPLTKKQSYTISLKIPEVSFEHQFIPSDLNIRLLLTLANKMRTEFEWENKYVIRPFDGFRSISRTRLMSYLRRSFEDYKQQIKGPCEIICKDGLWGIGYYKSINPKMSGIRIYPPVVWEN